MNTVPEFIDPVFTKTSPKRSFSLNRKRAFWLVFAKTESIISGTALEYSTRVVQEGDRRCKKSTLNDLAYLTPLRIPLMNPVYASQTIEGFYVAVCALFIVKRLYTVQ
jgi:hypothetical protein